MKKALLKNTFREIKNTKARFISIMLIVALGVGFMVGVKSTSPSMEQMAVDYYEESNLMDFRLLSTVGFDEDDVQAIKETDGVKDVMPSYFLDVSVSIDNVGSIFRLLSVPSKYKDNNTISDIHIVEGRLPQKSGEIVIEKTDLASYKIGDKIVIDPNVGEVDVKSQLKTLEYTVVGIVKSPMYISLDRGTTNVGNGKIDGFAYISEEDFDSQRYTVVYTTIDTQTENLSPFSDEYKKRIDEIAKNLEKTADARVEYFIAENIDKAQKEIDDGKAELDKAKSDAQSEFSKAEQELYDGEVEYYAQIYAAQIELADAKAQLDNMSSELSAQWALYEAALSELNAQLEQARQELDAYKVKLDEAYAAVDGMKALLVTYQADVVSEATTTINTIIASLPPDADKTIAQTLETYAASVTADNALLVLNTSKELLNANSYFEFDSLIDASISKVTEINANIKTTKTSIFIAESELQPIQEYVNAIESQINQKEQEGLSELDAYKAQLESAQAQLDSAQAQYENSQAQFENEKANGLKKIEDGKAELENSKIEADEEFAKAQQELDDAQLELDDVPQAQWYVFDRNDNPGYSSFKDDVGRIDAVAAVFPVFFLLVAMLVCLTTMTRLVEEKRTEIGTLKALGYSNKSITMKFVFYSGVASILGCAIGCAIGIPILPKVIYDAYGMLYNMRDINIVVAKGSLVVAIVASFVSCAFVTFVVCYKTLRHKPASLMRPKTPKAGKRILLERIPFLWKRFNFSSKVTFRNLFRYKSRLFMTALGIAGCTALMLTAFGLYDSINDVVKLQFEDISNYNTIIVTDAEKTKDEIAPLANAVDDDDRFNRSCIVMQKSVAVSSDSARLDSDIYLSVSDNAKDFESIINLRERESQKKLTIQNGTVVITEKLSNLLDVKVGDTIKIGDDDKATVGGIAENYVSNYVYMTSDTYKEITGDTALYNTVYANADGLNDEVETKLGTEYLKRSDVAGITFTSSISEDFKDMVSSMNMIVLVMIICAGALAVVVLYNLTNINLAERNREIATLKVLGFNHKETSAFVYRENIILTLFGVFIGLFLGVWLWQFVVDTVEVNAIMFGKSIHVLSYFLASILTVLFSLVVNFIMYFRIKAIDMVESLKSIE